MTAVAEDVKPPAESSTTGTHDVPEASSAPTPEPNLDPSTYNADEAREWKKTGAVPQLAPEPKAASAPASESAGAPEGDEPAAESAPASTQQTKKGKKNADARKSELNREIQDLLKRRDQLKAEVAAPAKTDATPAPSPAPKLPKVEKPEKPKKPVWGENPDEEWEQFQAREAEYDGQLDEYHEKLIAYSLAEDRIQNEKERREAETAAANKAVADGWKNRTSALKAREGYEDFDAVVAPLFAKENPPIPDGSVADAFILDSAVGPEMLYYFGQHLEEAEAVGHMHPLQAARILTVLERSILNPEPEAKAPRTEPKPVPPKPSAVTKTQAARPATDLRATNPAPALSELEAAIQADDVARFNKIRNQQTIEQRNRR